MSCTEIFNFNLVDQDATTITASSENAFFPASNIKDARTTKVWRSVDGVLSANIVLDFKTTETVSHIMVVGDSLRGLGFTSMTIEANITDSWGAPAFSDTLTPDQEFNLGFKKFATAQSYRFWRITISGGGNFVELSNLMLANESGLTRGIDFGWSYRNRDLSRADVNRYAQRFIDEITEQQSIRAKFSNMEKNDFEILQNIFDQNGKRKPIWIVVDSTETISNNLERFAGVYYIVDTPQFRNKTFSRYECTLRLVEAT